MKVAVGVKSLFWGFLCAGLGSPAWGAAKDLTGRFGLGGSNLGPQDQTPCVSLDWHANRAAHFEANLGIRSKTDNNLLLLDFRYSRNIFIEEQTLYFLYMGGGIMSEQLAGDNKSGWVLETGAGGKVFFSGLPNMGFSTRAGFLYKSLRGSTFQTVVNFGAHYYF